MKRAVLFFVSLMILMGSIPSLISAEVLILRNNLMQAHPGDYIVISANKTQTLMHIYDKKNDILTIEEVSIPENRTPAQINWKSWFCQNAPGNTSWVRYDLDLKTGQMINYYSFTKRNWFEIPDSDNFLSKLLNLRFTRIPDNDRKKIGPKSNSGPDFRPLWQPRMVFEGQPIKNVRFDAWKTKWPNDSSDLSGRTIEVYLPQNSQLYPSYFPYWLQINGAIGKAKIRMIDSGSGLQSPKPPLKYQ